VKEKRKAETEQLVVGGVPRSRAGEPEDGESSARCRIGRLNEEGCEAAHNANIIVLRIGSQAAHRMSSSMRCRSALTGRSTDETGIGCSSHGEGNSMLERQLRPAQDFIENAPHHPQHQSCEAGSCMGA
jgi:hypothetical protein